MSEVKGQKLMDESRAIKPEVKFHKYISEDAELRLIWESTHAITVDGHREIIPAKGVQFVESSLIIEENPNTLAIINRLDNHPQFGIIFRKIVEVEGENLTQKDIIVVLKDMNKIELAMAMERLKLKINLDDSEDTMRLALIAGNWKPENIKK